MNAQGVAVDPAYVKTVKAWRERVEQGVWWRPSVDVRRRRLPCEFLA